MDAQPVAGGATGQPSMPTPHHAARQAHGLFSLVSWCQNAMAGNRWNASNALPRYKNCYGVVGSRLPHPWWRPSSSAGRNSTAWRRRRPALHAATWAAAKTVRKHHLRVWGDWPVACCLGSCFPGSCEIVNFAGVWIPVMRCSCSVWLSSGAEAVEDVNKMNLKRQIFT